MRLSPECAPDQGSEETWCTRLPILTPVLSTYNPSEPLHVGPSPKTAVQIAPTPRLTRYIFWKQHDSLRRACFTVQNGVQQALQPGRVAEVSKCPPLTLELDFVSLRRDPPRAPCFGPGDEAQTSVDNWFLHARLNRVSDLCLVFILFYRFAEPEQVSRPFPTPSSSGARVSAHQRPRGRRLLSLRTSTMGHPEKLTELSLTTERRSQTHLVSRHVCPCFFIPLRE